ncbi:MAG: 2-C-methyl-D-erythritol 4-phosphate cytidylyltransferase [Alphaproteobacteria bacterium]|jgi:2-C-methyl-D-erythritol 4-phosphate cytidylyltransferase/2-C-methyl-D-erythritol 2,4-cyclodiphosphate synthase
MDRLKKKIAIVVAAGSGNRAQTVIPKQYVLVKQKAVIDYTVQNLCACPHIDHVLCVIDQKHQDLYDAAITPHEKLLPAIHGGQTRQESVYAGLSALKNDAVNVVFIHDAARPNIDSVLVNALIKHLKTHDGVCPALGVTDSLRKIDGTIINRDGLFRVQTPQAFDFEKIMHAHQQCKTLNITDLTDDIAVANAQGLATTFIEGSENNYKITYPQDFDRFTEAQSPSNTMPYPDMRVATGYDVHRLIAGDGVILGGIKIACNYALKGHSDADVALHAITDALLGTIAAQDIGYHFSPTDLKWENANSADFLRYAHQLVLEQKGIINFIDLTLVCETPKINPHRDLIQNNIANILNLPTNRISVKATTTEKLGFTGRKEGIAAQATATVILFK